MTPTTARVELGAKHYLSVFTILSLVVFCGGAALDLETARSWTFTARDLVTHNFDWLFIYTASLVLISVTALAFHPRARMKLGADDEEPEFSRWSWFAMLFSAGLASGLLYWATAEPIIHFGGNPYLAQQGISAGTPTAATNAVTLTIFHWGLHGWGMYVLAGLAIGLNAFRYGRPLAFSSALAPLLGEKGNTRWLANVVDLLALYGTVFGVATSIGLAVGSMNASVEPLVDISFSRLNQIGIILLVCTLGTLSVLSGVKKGIRRLSEINIWVSIGLLLAIVMLGPTDYLLRSLPVNLFDYTVNVIPMGLWTAAKPAHQEWQSAWTVFYWGWWLAWTPFVALFIARISRGRTVREFILGVLFVPAIIIVLWMTVFGGTALNQELQASGAVSEAVAADYSRGLVATIQNLTDSVMAPVLLAIVAFLLFTWLVTSLDSATLVICHILRFDHLGSMKVLWGFILGAVACTLMLIGGLPALQAASIIIGLPMAVILLLVLVSTVRIMFRRS